MKYFLTKFFRLLFLMLLPLGCLNDVDFDQANDLKFSHQLDLPLVYYDLNYNSFVDTSGYPITYMSDITDIRINTKVLEKTTGTVMLELQTTNTFDTNFEIQVDFMDSFANLLFTKNIAVPANSVEYHQNINIEGNEVELFKRMQKVRSSITMTNTGVTIQTDDILEIKSAIHFTIAYTTE